jgi:CBS domain-containing protein
VVNDEGLLVGSLSSSDLKQLNASSFLHLLDPLSKWNKSNRLLFVTKSTSLDAIVKRMSEWRAHRVFVVEAADNMKLVGVISLQDIIKKLEF